MALFDYNLSVSGDCQATSSGAYQISFYGAVPPYTLQFISPSQPTQTLGENVPYTRTGLFAQTIQLTVNDSTLPTNQSFNIKTTAQLREHPPQFIHLQIISYTQVMELL